MGKKKALLAMTLLALILFATGAVAGGEPQAQSGSIPTGPQLVKGKIAYLDRLGGYYIEGIDPVGIIMIDNQDQVSLQPLVKSGKVVQVLGRFTVGVDNLKIEKIDGKPYLMKKTAK
jgi:hypothetical protein